MQRRVLLDHLPAVLRLESTCRGGGGPRGRLRWLAISLMPWPRRVEVEDLLDDRRLLGVDDEARLAVAGAGAARVGVRLVLEAVAVRGAAAVAVALAAVLGLAAAASRLSFSTSN